MTVQHPDLQKRDLHTPLNVLFRKITNEFKPQASAGLLATLYKTEMFQNTKAILQVTMMGKNPPETSGK